MARSTWRKRSAPRNLPPDPPILLDLLLAIFCIVVGALNVGEALNGPLEVIWLGAGIAQAGIGVLFWIRFWGDFYKRRSWIKERTRK